MPLKSALKQIEEKSGIAFAYNADMRELDNPVTQSFTNESIQNILTTIFNSKNTPFDFKMIGEQIIVFKRNVSKKKPLQTIRGSIFDQQTRRVLPGATVMVVDADSVIGTSSDINGEFILEGLAIGRYTLKFSYIGYQTKIIDNILLGAGNETVLDVGVIEEVSTTLKAIVISAHKNYVAPTNEMATVSARSISAEETKRYAGSLNDPSRMALSYAGVANENGYNNGIVIRGNSPKGLLWRLEGIEIPNPNHLAVEGSSGGLINILNSNNMARSDFFISAFPAEYGNAYSGIFDLKMRNGNANKREHSFEAGLLGISFSTEGPLKEGSKGSYLINYRYSTYGIITKLNTEIQGPDFQDLTFKINIPTKRAGTFSVFGLGGLGKWIEDEDFAYIDTVTQKEIRHTAKNLQHYDMGIIGISHKLPVNDKTFIETIIAASATQNRPTSSGFNYDSLDTYLQERGAFLNSTYRLASTINKKISAKHILRAGIKVNHLTFSLSSESGLPDGLITRNVEKRGSADLAQAFAAWQYRSSNRWIINTGIHLTYFSLSKEFVAEPRFGLKKELDKKRVISLGAGLHSRHEPLSSYYGEYEKNGLIVQPNKNLKLSRAAHFVLGYDESLSHNLHLKIEMYYQHLFNIPVEDSIGSSYSSLNDEALFTPIILTNKGIGRNYGIELTLEKHYSKKYYYLLTTSIFDSKYKTLDYEWRNTRYNINYVVNLIGGKEFTIGKKSKSNVIGLNVRGSVTGGKRATPIDLVKSMQAGYEIQMENLAFSKQLDDYYRIDFSAYLKWERKRSSHIIKLDILNLIEQNVLGIRYVPSKFGAPAYVQEYSFNQGDEATSNRFPILSYRINFGSTRK